VRGLVLGELRPAPADPPRTRAEASPSFVFATISSRWSSASTDSIPNIARPSMVAVSMPLLDDVQPDVELAQLGAEGHQVQYGAGEPVEPGHLQRVALAQQLHDEELRAGRFRAAGDVDVDVVAVDAVAE
jgi:hypothetical protein